MTGKETFIYESIVSQLRIGFYSVDEIKDNIMDEIEDNEFDNEISEEWAFELIDKEWKNIVAESKLWESPTDAERLITAFDALCNANIIALHNTGYETSDGEYEVVEVERALRTMNITSDGYCFYHGQDLERAITKENPMLYITFNKIDNTDPQVAIGVGKKVVEILLKYGFEVTWNETATTRILINKFCWQQIYNDNNRDLLDYDKVVALMAT